MRGVYQHCAKKHLHRHAAEFDFRYSYFPRSAGMTACAPNGRFRGRLASV